MREFDLGKRTFDISVGMSCLIVISGVFSVISFFAADMEEVYRIALSGLCVALSCSAAILVIRAGAKEDTEYSVRHLTGREAAALLPLFFASFSVYYLLSEVSRLLFSLIGLEMQPTEGLPASLGGRIAYILCAAVVPAVLEELLFRGTVLRLLLPAGEKFAVCVSGALFALSHWHPQRFLPVFFISAVYSLVYLTTGSILSPILLHLLNNLAVIAQGWIAAELGEQAGRIFLYVLLGLGALSLLLLLPKREKGKERAIREMEADCDWKDMFGTGGIWVMFVLYTVMMLQSLGV